MHKASTDSNGTRRSVTASSPSLATLEVTAEATLTTDGTAAEAGSSSGGEITARSGQLPLGGCGVPEHAEVELAVLHPCTMREAAQLQAMSRAPPDDAPLRRSWLMRFFTRPPKAAQGMRTAAAQDNDPWRVQCGCL
jgi:hypothetical protein